MFFEVIPTEVYRNGSGVLTYSSDTPLLPGHIVLIPIGKRTVIGIVLRQVKSVDFPTKPITRLIHPYPLPPHLLKSITWLSDYYLSPLTACANLMIPAGIASRTVLKTQSTQSSNQNTDQNPTSEPTPTDITPINTKIHPIPLNPAQKNALQSLQEAPGTTRLLRGVTGSGKTNIYLKMALNALEAQKSTILLVPEIALTSQLVKIFESTFGPRVLLIHSNQTMSERRKIWLNILNATYNTVVRGGVRFTSEGSGGSAEDERDDTVTTGVVDAPSEVNLHPPEPLIIIGPRSALLTPVHNLGLIIIDESHEGTYYQENTPRYSSLRLASFMASTGKFPCILGSATPNIVDFYLARSKDSLVELSTKAKTTAIDPKISLIDLKDRTNFTKNRYFSNKLLTNIKNNIQDKHQTLIFHNRRGSAPITLCEHCGWQALCPECFLPMILHADTYTLSCHVCGHEEKVPIDCPSCHKPGIIHKGFGTKLLESELSQLFPEAKIARFDGDNTKNDDLASLYQEVKSGEIDILIGTQTLARGLDLPHLATVGIIQADAGLSLPDFAAEERTFELLTQVIGRVGRGHLDIANVVVQTYQPEHPVLQASLSADFAKFSDYLLQNRRKSHLPPFSHLARLSVTYKTEKTTLTKIRQAHQILARAPKLTISPPMPAFHERTTRGYTWQIVLKSPSRSTLLAALQPFAQNKQFSIVLDPPSLL